MRGRVTHGVTRVGSEVDQNLFQLNAVDQRQRQLLVEAEFRCHTVSHEITSLELQYRPDACVYVNRLHRWRLLKRDFAAHKQGTQPIDDFDHPAIGHPMSDRIASISFKSGVAVMSI
jgi:hypothetical protein